MLFFKKVIPLLTVTICLSLISCKGKSEKQTIVGKWEYKELIYTSSKRYQDLSPRQQQRKKEEDDREAKGTMLIFNKDKTYSVSTKQGEREQLITGTYEINEDNELVSKETGKDRTEKLKILSIEKNEAQFQVPADGIILVFNRI